MQLRTSGMALYVVKEATVVAPNCKVCRANVLYPCLHANACYAQGCFCLLPVYI